MSVVNVGFRLSATARHDPEGVAVAMPRGREPSGRRIYESLTFRELDDDSNLLADGLAAMGVQPGTRLALMVPPSIDFISLVFAMFKAGVVTVLIDPGMGRANMIRCLAESEPEGFIGIPLAQALRTILRGRFPKAKYNVTVGRRWFWGGTTLAQLRSRSLRNRPGTSVDFRSAKANPFRGAKGDYRPVIDSPALTSGFRPVQTQGDDPAAIIFTTGSTGPPKGVLYRHGNFNQQVDELRDFYNIQPGEIDLPGFPLFALFNCAMGVTTVIPDMDPTRPARVDPRKIVEAVNDWKVTQAFGSPALWNVVGRYCEDNQIVLPTLKRVLSAGAPVPVHVLKRMKAAIAADGDVHTPYGATEALPVASNSASEVLSETSSLKPQASSLPHGRGTTEALLVASNSASEVLSETSSLTPQASSLPHGRGTTEALLVASNSASEVLSETSSLKPQASSLPHGRGTCVGRHFPGIEWKVIRITDEPIATLAEAEELPAGEIGELIVRGPVVTTEYVTRTEANALHKIRDGATFWHRMGDVGYLEKCSPGHPPCGSAPRDVAPDAARDLATGLHHDGSDERFWFCGRKSHRVITASGTLYTIPCEAIFNQHPWVYRSALVGIGQRGQQRPVVFIESWPEHWPAAKNQWQKLVAELRHVACHHPHTTDIQDFLLLRALPVDIRHNAKIFREQLAVLAAKRLGDRKRS